MIKEYAIFGERNSGTNYLNIVMQDNFNLVQTHDYGYKHWYIKDHYPRGPKNVTTDNECIKSIKDPSADTVLFIYIVREPLSWLSSMHRNPWHAPNHKELSFSEFIRKSWISFETTLVNSPVIKKERIWKRTNGIYLIETAPNICILRNIKNAHFIALKNIVKNFIIIQQEHLHCELLRMSYEFNLVQKNGIGNIVLNGYITPKESNNDTSKEDLDFITDQLLEPIN